MVSRFSLPLTNTNLSTSCTSCHMGKLSKPSLRVSDFRSSNILDLVYCDVWGPAPVIQFEGHRFFVLCVDHNSRYMWIYPLAHNSDVYDTFKRFVAMVERPFFSSLGIVHQRSRPHKIEQNGFVERRHVVETGLTLLAQASTPQRFWHFSFDTTIYLINFRPSRTSTNKSPFEYLFNRTLGYSFLHVFTCQCFPHLCPYNRHKMDFWSIPCVLLGYSPIHHGYHCLDLSTKSLYIAHHVRFNEDQFLFAYPK